MRYTLKMLFVIFSIPFLLCTTGFSTNITIYDGNGYNGTGIGFEDGETEPGMVNTQAWDLEAFLFDGDNLTMVGGYDFDEGVMGNAGFKFTSGDIFIRTGSEAPINGPRNDDATNTFGYNYVIDLDFDERIYNVFSIDETAIVEYSYYSKNIASDPWQYFSGGAFVKSGSIFYAEGISVDGFEGVDHNTVTVALDFLDADTKFYAHFTMQCGNDNLMGYGTIPNPEPTTLLLFGFGLLGIARIGRKKTMS